MRVDSLKVRKKARQAPPPLHPLFKLVLLISEAYKYLVSYFILQIYGLRTFEMVHKFTEKETDSWRLTSYVPFLISLFFCLLLTLNWTPAFYRYLYKSFWFFSLNFSGEIFRRTGHPSRQFGKIIDVLWPWFLYCKIISRTCVQSKMGQPSLCFSSR